MSTLARQKDAYGDSSRIAARFFASLAAFNATGARYIRDGTVSVPTSTPLERLMNYVPVGAIARAIAMTFFVHGTPAKADALYLAAERLSIVTPGASPNVLDFTTERRGRVTHEAVDVVGEVVRVRAVRAILKAPESRYLAHRSIQCASSD